MKFGNRFRQLRKEKHLTLKEVSEIMGMSVAHISAVERCEKAPFTPSLIRVFLENINQLHFLDELVLLSFKSRDVIAFHRVGQSKEWDIIALIASQVLGGKITESQYTMIELLFLEILEKNKAVK